MTNILILRFSAMGDVLLLVPVLRSLVATHPHVSVTVVTRPRFASFFAGIERVHVFEADVDKLYTGFFGLRRLFRALLASKSYSVVIDMHDHIRTMFLRNLFKLAGKKVVVFNKGRREKKAFVRKHNKITKPLQHTVDRYRNAFRMAGYDFDLIKGPHLVPSSNATDQVNRWLTAKGFVKKHTWIGIAPFALHTSKIWPLAQYPSLIDELIRKFDATIFLFGGGELEIKYFHEIRSLFPKKCAVVAGELTMPEEIALCHKLDLMVCVDSSNMHLAALAGTPLISIWGGTHPDVGFAPYGCAKENILQIDQQELPCRPCSVFGKESCHRGDFACLTHITQEMILNRIEKILT